MTDMQAISASRLWYRIGQHASWLYLPLVVVAFFIPNIFGGGSLGYETILLIAVYAIMAYGADFILSYLGEVSLGHTLFFAAGAYISAILSKYLHWSALLTLVAALVGAAILAFFVGLFTLRTREFVFSLVTYGSALIAITIVSNTKFLGGTDGIVGIPPLTIPAIGGTYTALTPQQIWPIAFVCLVMVVYFVHRFRRSRLGVAATMVQSNRSLAASMGIDAGRVRLIVFTISAPVSALAGWIYAYQRAYISTDLFDPYFLLMMLTAIILPGRRQLLGPIIGTALIVGQQQLFSLGAAGDDIILGAVLLLVLVLWPDGLAGLVRVVVNAFRRRGSDDLDEDSARLREGSAELRPTPSVSVSRATKNEQKEPVT
jgi:branched-chain amino acid transport system permease protein